MENFIDDEEVKKLESCAQSSTVPQLWSADGGEPMSISDIVKNRGKAKNKSGKLYNPKKWTPVGLSDTVKKWIPKGKADDE
jgi:hypothetical protein